MGTAFESNAKFGESIYFHDDKGLFVNLFIPSVLDWKKKGLRVRQETAYPEEATTRLIIESAPAAALPLFIRYPSWAIEGATVKVNGKKLRVSQKPGSYITISRLWKSGDRVEVTFPMSLRLVPANDNPNMAAIAYGPVLLAGAMGAEGLQPPAPYAKDQNDLNKYPIPTDMVHSLNTKGAAVSGWLKPVAGQPLTFTTEIGVAPQEITLIPYYKLHHQRYVVYWNLASSKKSP